MIRSRIGSSGRVVTSTITWLLSRMSVTPPCAPAGAASTDSVSSTMSPTLSSAMATIASIVGLGVCGNQAWCCLCIRVVPCRGDSRGPLIDDQLDEGPTADAGVLFVHSRDESSDYCRGDQAPNEICVFLGYPEDASPFGAMTLLRKDPIGQLDPLTPCVGGAGKRLADLRWPCHTTHAMEQRRTCVRLRSILRVEKHTKGARR